MVGNLGAQLSGGQKQRIAIARIILKDPTVYLLDEITSALDTKTEKAIYDEIFKIASRRTAIIVTHSLSSVENVDSIAVMHQGKIVEQGNYVIVTCQNIYLITLLTLSCLLFRNSC